MQTPNLIGPSSARNAFGLGGGPGALLAAQTRHALETPGFVAQHFGGVPMGAFGTPRPSMRADTASTLQGGVEPLISTAVLLLGTPQWATFFGSIVCPDVVKTSWRMGYWTWSSAPHLNITAEGFTRGFSEARQQVKFTGARVETSMTRRGAESPLDVDHIRIADSALRMEAHAAMLSMAAVKLDVEWAKVNLFGPTTTGLASYPAGHTNNATGSEWDAAGGDSKADIDAMVDQLLTANPPYQRDSIRVVITRGAFEAAKRDPTWLAIRANFVDRQPNLEDLRGYWDVGSIEIADAVYAPTEGATPISMWGDTAIGFIDKRLQGGLQDEWGSSTFAVNFTFAGAVISAPYYEPRTTTNWYPYDGYDHPTIIQPAGAYIVYNVKA